MLTRELEIVKLYRDACLDVQRIAIGSRSREEMKRMSDVLGEVFGLKVDDTMRIEIRQMRTDLTRLILQLDRQWTRHYFSEPDGTSHSIDDEWNARCDEVLQMIRKVDKAMDGERAVEITSEYRATLLQSNGTASKRAHLATQLPDEWVPAKTKDPHTGVVTADPLNVLLAERKRLCTLWLGKDTEAPSGWQEPFGGHEQMPRISPSQWRRSSKLFAKGTSYTYDGFHPRHYSLLSDRALEVLSTICQVSEGIGKMPPSVRPITVALIPKPKGGLRPVGLFPCLLRVWAKAGLPIVEEWEAKNGRTFFACGKGKGATHAVWRQALLCEAGVGRAEQSAAFLWDLRSFFDI